jgi:mRNA-degrading endonuclease toxin of MazEF toxin-antitoxin module
MRIGVEARRDLVGRFRRVSAPRADRPAACSHWQSDALTRALQSILVVPLTTNLERAQLAGTAMIEATENGLSQTSVALAFQMRAIPRSCLLDRIRNLTDDELGELELATDEALGRVEPERE